MTEKNSNFWDLNTTKEVIQKCLDEDEREIKSRDPKRKVISEEKWGEGENWKEIIREGEEREKVLLTQCLTRCSTSWSQVQNLWSQ